jgi:hypothetical protein
MIKDDQLKSGIHRDALLLTADGYDPSGYGIPLDSPSTRKTSLFMIVGLYSYKATRKARATPRVKHPQDAPCRPVTMRCTADLALSGACFEVSLRAVLSILALITRRSNALSRAGDQYTCECFMESASTVLQPPVSHGLTRTWS